MKKRPLVNDALFGALDNGEPYLLVRASDRLSAAMINSYAAMVVSAAHGLLHAGDNAGASHLSELAREVEDLADRVVDWQVEHKNNGLTLANLHGQ